MRAKVKLKFNFSDGVIILGNSYHFIINSVALTFYTQIDKIMIGKAIDETILGYYTAASAISVMWEVIPNAVLNSARPLFVQKYDMDRKEFLKRYQLVILGISILGIGVGIGFMFFAKFLVWILYGPDYYAAIPALKILAWATVCSSIGSVRTTWMVLNNKSKYMEYFTLIGAVINISLNLVFIHFWGYIGAALATFITSFITGIILPFLFRGTREYALIFIGSFRQILNFVEYIWNKITIKDRER
jgi:Membrane protein involved in the export of O-antigen and teichoic acid